MRRSERLFRESVYFFLQSFAALVCAFACAVWGYGLMLGENFLFHGLWIASIIALLFATRSAGEAFRLHRMSLDEEARERRNAIRPHI